MGMNYQLERAWVNTYKGIRQCQKADKTLSKGNAKSAAEHYDKALNFFTVAVEHMDKADDDAVIKAGKLLDQGNGELGKAVEEYLSGDDGNAEKHYEKALAKYDKALDLVA